MHVRSRVFPRDNMSRLIVCLTLPKLTSPPTDFLQPPFSPLSFCSSTFCPLFVSLMTLSLRFSSPILRLFKLRPRLSFGARDNSRKLIIVRNNFIQWNDSYYCTLNHVQHCVYRVGLFSFFFFDKTSFVDFKLKIKFKHDSFHYVWKIVSLERWSPRTFAN